MKTFVVVALMVAFAAVAFADEEKRLFSFGCKSDQDCDEGCCAKFLLYGKCRKYLKEGAICFSRGIGKRGIGFKPSCGCGEGLTCQKSGRVLSRCAVEEGSGDM
ncbi:Hypothetical predicted protein [Paramuricea clavata]|uniref:Uncharacterized protein n=1 Tax=Paramuricea clavata TaxID=317549 RepID=A0A7D9DDN7_PARCT|nr:Hypothetical predicted protein [Paramuricea clavata]